MNATQVIAHARRGILARIAELQTEIERLRNDVTALDAEPTAITIEPNPAATLPPIGEPSTPAPTRRKHRKTRRANGWTPERRAAQARRAKRYWRALRKNGK